MSNVLVNEEYLSGIANAIRAKNGSGNTYTPGQMAAAIGDISGGSAVLTTKNITQNGTYNASSDDADGYSSVVVNVSGGSGAQPVAPYAFDDANGFVAGPTFNYGPSDGLACDAYLLEPNTAYVLCLGNPVGNRFRASIFASDPVTATSNISGVQITFNNDPVVYKAALIDPSQVTISSKYLYVQKTNVGEKNIKTYLYKISDLAQ